MADRNVLIVTPDKALCADAVPTLRREGFTARTAPDAVSALMSARKETPDVLVIDRHLAGGGGPSLLQRLRSLVPTALTPAVGLAEEEGEVRELREAGAEEVVLRPVDTESLVELIQRTAGVELQPEEVPQEVLADSERMEVLEATGQLDSDQEPVFDYLTSLASALLPAPVSLLTLVDDDRQFLKSVKTSGSWDPGEGDRETSLSYSFCQWAVASEEPLTVSDAREHPLLRHNRAVDERGVVAYAGVPLIVRGRALGTVCAVDGEPRNWEDADLALLDDLADIARIEMGLRLDRDRLALENGDSHEFVARAIESVASIMGTVPRELESEELASCSALLRHFGSRLRQI